MKEKTKLFIGTAGCFILCVFGVYRLLVENPSNFTSMIIPVIFALSGFLGFVTNVYKLSKRKSDNI
ncbi:hypothetical protein [Cytobacillus gottheilii]|uniref:Group-specific protein n=1 Tax=Cytobacillus gottheilii TaxID=859144 RepID=A0ABX8FF38_9BACI|nr:hypothetical protein [Cytobacillus gottheilii]QVY62620.1 hypothetical protein J1899_06030 [Cytobacillus gottheilii]